MASRCCALRMVPDQGSPCGLSARAETLVLPGLDAHAAILRLPSRLLKQPPAAPPRGWRRARRDQPVFQPTGAHPAQPSGPGKPGSAERRLQNGLVAPRWRGRRHGATPPTKSDRRWGASPAGAGADQVAPPIPSALSWEKAQMEVCRSMKRMLVVEPVLKGHGRPNNVLERFSLPSIDLVSRTCWSCGLIMQLFLSAAE